MIRSISEETNKSPWSMTEVAVLPEWLWTKQEAQLWMSHEKWFAVVRRKQEQKKRGHNKNRWLLRKETAQSWVTVLDVQTFRLL